MEVSSSKSLPENAYRPLKPGETYEPIVPAASQMKEFTPRSVTVSYTHLTLPTSDLV